MSVDVIDSFAELGCKTSRFLTKDELRDVKPDFPQSRMNFIFKHNIPLSVETGIGKLLVDKFDEVNYHGESDSYEDMDYTELKEIAKEKGIKAHFVKRDELVQKLNKAD